MKPSILSTEIDKCPICRKKGSLRWWLPENKNLFGKLEMVCFHKDATRNTKCFTGVIREAYDGEIVESYKANPMTAPFL